MVVVAVARRVGLRSMAVLSVLTAGLGASVVSGAVPAAGAAPSSCSPSEPVYRVRAGDSWFAIADRVAVSATALLDANGATLERALAPGDSLCLPEGTDMTGVCEVSHTVAAGEGWSVIAAAAGAAVADVVAANGTTTDRVLHPGEVVCLPPGSTTTGAAAGATASTAGAASGGGATYTVEAGDSWFDIATRAGVTVRALLAANDSDADDVLLPGDVVELPAGATAPAATRAATRAQDVELDVLPVQGPCWYGDTWRDPRGGGRLHAGMDIITARGKYVYAVTDGRLTERAWDQPWRISGNAWKLTADDGTSFYYAHLEGFAPDLRVGSRVEAGQIIGWVGETGNASGPHLHFEIRPGGGETVNPYPAIDAAGGCNRGTPYTQPSGWTPQ